MKSNSGIAILVITFSNKLTATKTLLVICVGVFGTITLFLLLNLSSSLFEQNHNTNGIAAIIGVGSISNIGEKGGVGRSEGSFSVFSLFSIIPQYAYAIEHTIAVQHSEGPKIMVNNSNLKIETVFKGGLKLPTSMAFLGPNDILVLEKDNGTVQRIVDGKMLPHPVLKVPVASKLERGMLGIAIARHRNNNNAAVTNTANTSNTNTSNALAFPFIPFNAEEGNERGKSTTATTTNTNNTTTYVFLYYTQSGGGKNGDDHPINCYCNYKNADDHPKGGAKPIQPLGNRLYRYEFDEHNNKLINPKLLLDLPATTHKVYETDHMGGRILIGPDNNVYVAIGDVGAHLGKAENIQMGKGLNRGKGLDGTGGILRVTQDGKPVEPPLLGNNTYPANIYYAYGIRNSFGIDFDPVTKRLWDTENGPDYGD
ncbi:MAG TPA: PQQ-dependent sugar dehydrogenase, partial [Nitrososphaeraceae archaeon]